MIRLWPRTSPSRYGCSRLLYVALAAACALALIGPQCAAATTSPWTPSAAALALPTNPTSIDWVTEDTACSPTDVCVSVGHYEDGSGDKQAFVAPTVDGIPQPAVEVALPGDAAAVPNAALDSVACQSGNTCTAVGSYQNGTSVTEEMAVQINDGVPGTAVAITPPAGSVSGEATLYSLACPSSGACVAVGSSASSSTGEQEPWVATFSGGVQTSSEFVTPPSDFDTADPAAVLYGVACQGSGACVAVGNYLAGSSGDHVAMVVPLNSGTAASAEAVTPPPNVYTGGDPGASLTMVACPATGTCEAMGGYNNAAPYAEDMAVAISAGSPGAAVAVPPPSDAYSEAPDVELAGLACSSATVCVAGGYYYTSSTAYQAAVAVIGDGGASFQRVALPSDASISEPYSDIGDGATGSAVGCVASGPCLAIGWYYTSYDSGEAYQGLAVEVSSSGQVEPAQATPVPTDSTNPPMAYLYGGIGCDGGGSCVTAGAYESTTQGHQPYELSESAPLSITTASLPSGSQDQAYPSTTLAATGAWGVYSWSVASGSLPSGLSLNAQTGVISGTPTGSGTATFTVEVTGTGSPLPTATEQLSIAVTAAPAAVAGPVVRLLSSSRKVSGGRLGVKLSCSGAPCHGTVKLEQRKVVVLKRGRRRVRKHETVVLGKAGYSVAAGATKSISVRLGKAGRRALVKAKKHRLKVSVVATLTGGRSASRSETIYTLSKARRK